MTHMYMQAELGDQYKLYLLADQKDERPVAVVLPAQAVQVCYCVGGGLGWWEDPLHAPLLVGMRGVEGETRN
jgi:hypothetical protein